MRRGFSSGRSKYNSDDSDTPDNKKIVKINMETSKRKTVDEHSTRLHNMDKAAEALMVKMESRFEKICLQVVHKSDAERRKNTEADIVKYKERMEQIMFAYIEKIHDYVQNSAKERQQPKAKGFIETVFSRAPVADDSEDSNNESDESTDSAKKSKSAASAAKKKSSSASAASAAKKRSSAAAAAKKKSPAVVPDSAEDETAALEAIEHAANAEAIEHAANAEAIEHAAKAKAIEHAANARASEQAAKAKKSKKAADEAPKGAYNLRSRGVVKTGADIQPVVDDFEGWGSDLSDNDDGSMDGMEEVVHLMIIKISELPDPSHDTLDNQWVGLSNLHLDGPTRTDIENVIDRQAMMLRILTVLHDKVNAEAIRLHVLPDTLYRKHASIPMPCAV
jgi:hypothetical protein